MKPRLMSEVTLQIVNLPGHDDVLYGTNGRIRFSRNSKVEPSVSSTGQTLIRVDGDTTRASGDFSVANIHLGSIHMAEVQVSVLHTNDYNEVDSAVRFRMPADGSTPLLTYDFSTRRWTGAELVDDEVQVRVVNDTHERRFVQVEDGERPLGRVSVASNASTDLVYRPFGSVSSAFLQHSAKPDNSSADMRYAAAPTSGTTHVVRLAEGTTPDEAASQTRQTKHLVIVMVVLVALILVLALVHFVTHGWTRLPFTRSWRVAGMPEGEYV